jgi:hypothetical protein
MKRLLALMFGLLVVGVVYSQKKELSLHLEKGKEYSQVQHTTSVITQTMEGQEMKTDMDISTNTVYKVTQVNATSYDMEVQYKTIGMKMNMAGQSVEFDSKNPDAANPFSVIMSNMCNKPFLLRMSKKGKVEEIKDAEKIFDDMFKGVQLDDTQKEQIRQQMMKSYGETALQSSIEAATSFFPEKAVAVNEKWNTRSKLVTSTALNVNTAYTLNSYTATAYTISGSSTLETADKNAVTESNGIPMKFDLKGKMNSTIKVDAKTGWISELKLVQELAGNTSMTMGEQSLTIPMTTKTETTVTNK